MSSIFRPGPDWDLTIPGKLHSALVSEYGGKPRNQQVVDVGVEIKRDEPSNIRYGQGLAKVLLFTEDEKRAVGVGPDVLSVHMLRPYQKPEAPEESGWDEFRPRIATALEAYWRVADPVGVRRISIRYINRIIIPEPVVRTEDYLRCAPPSIQGLPDRLHSYMSRNRLRVRGWNSSCPGPGHHHSAIWRNRLPARHRRLSGDRRGRHDSSSTSENRTCYAASRGMRFETVITDTARELFDAD